MEEDVRQYNLKRLSINTLLSVLRSIRISAKSMPRFQAGLLKDHGQGAKPGDGRLKKIKTDKSCKEQPVWTVNHGKDYTENNNTAGKG